MARKNTAQLKTDNNNRIYTNALGKITALIDNILRGDYIDSFLNVVNGGIIDGDVRYSSTFAPPNPRSLVTKEFVEALISGILPPAFLASQGLVNDAGTIKLGAEITETRTIFWGLLPDWVVYEQFNIASKIKSFTSVFNGSSMIRLEFGNGVFLLLNSLFAESFKVESDGKTSILKGVSFNSVTTAVAVVSIDRNIYSLIYTGVAIGTHTFTNATAQDVGRTHKIYNNSAFELNVFAFAGQAIRVPNGTSPSVNMQPNSFAEFVWSGTSWQFNYQQQESTLLRVNRSNVLTQTLNYNFSVWIRFGAGAGGVWTLPLGVIVGRGFVIKNEITGGANNLTIALQGGQQFFDSNAVNTLTLTAGGHVNVVWDGAFWTVLSN